MSVVGTGIRSPAQDSCPELERACEEIIKSAGEYIEAQDKELKKVTELNIVLQEDVEALNKKIIELRNPPWYTDPKITFLIGVIAGGSLVYKISK